MTKAEKKEVMAAWLDNVQIQQRALDGKSVRWIDCPLFESDEADDFEFDFTTYEYRVKPEESFLDKADIKEAFNLWMKKAYPYTSVYETFAAGAEWKAYRIEIEAEEAAEKETEV